MQLSHSLHTPISQCHVGNSNRNVGPDRPILAFLDRFASGVSDPSLMRERGYFMDTTFVRYPAKSVSIPGPGYRYKHFHGSGRILYYCNTVEWKGTRIVCM